MRRLGVTAVELLPIHAWVRDRQLLERGLTNYWGYNTLAYFAPEPAYLSDGSLGQVKWVVQQLHAVGIEVLLDVVCNHSCEGSELGPTLSLRGFGNADYYRLLPENPRHYLNDTGSGNTLNFSHPRTIQLVMDSLRYWVSEFHVDGFRFDLSVILGREAHGFDPGCGFFDALLQDPLLSRVKQISEPWDMGLGGYQVGRHPAGMAEWNDRYRDDVRRYWRGNQGLRGALAARLQGSAELFDHHRRRPWSSVNFVTAHDGFTLEDLVSDRHKCNQANGEENADGSDDSHSHNWGVEGPSEEPQILAQRELVKRNLIATLLFSQGTPMLLAGDEFGQTQASNNNGYCQDNPTCWLDWTRADGERGAALHGFVIRALALRREHPLLRGNEFQHAEQDLLAGVRAVLWFDERGIELDSECWHNASAWLLGLRRARRTDGGHLVMVTLLCTSEAATHVFCLPPPNREYRVLLDTRDEARRDTPLPEPRCTVEAGSLVLLAARARVEDVHVHTFQAAEHGDVSSPQGDDGLEADAG